MKSSVLLEYSNFSASEIRDKLTKISRVPVQEINVLTAAVLIPLFRKRNQWHVLFIHRSHWVNNHKDQVSFPGGMVEQGDKEVLDTALRETREELGIPPQQVQVLGQLHPMVFRNEYKIFPIVGQIPWPIELTLSPLEVSHIFSVPFNWLANPGHYSRKEYKSPEGEKRQVYFYNKYRDELLWGISAFITIDLVDKLK